MTSEKCVKRQNQYAGMTLRAEHDGWKLMSYQRSDSNEQKCHNHSKQTLQGCGAVDAGTGLNPVNPKSVSENRPITVIRKRFEKAFLEECRHHDQWLPFIIRS